MNRMSAALGALAVLAATPVAARDLAFTARLSGTKAPTLTGSKASGAARIVAHEESQTVDIAMDVDGLTVDDLWANLRPRPMGPIHLHLYGGTDHSPAADAVLVFPVPYGETYAPTAKGFRVRMSGMPYAKGAAIVATKASFAEFVAALQTGKVVLNVHTNRFNDGEISGDVVPAQASGGGGVL